MKKFKKILALALSLAMVLGMGVTTFAANGTPEKGDTATIKIEGITGAPKVTLYELTTAKYGSDDKGFSGFDFAEGVSALLKTTDPATGALTPTADEISQIANALVGGSITLDSGKTTEQILSATDTEFSKVVGAGLYIAILTGANDGTVYNPILLTATYAASGNLEDGGVNLGNPTSNGYLYGSTATAKKTTAKIEKSVEATGEEDGKQSASVGDVLTYTIAATMPTYPAKAVNKTFFISDTMSEGQTFLLDSVEIKLKDLAGNFLKDAVEKDKDLVITANSDGVFSTTLAGESESRDIAEVAGTIVGNDGKTTTTLNGAAPSGFYLKFNYDALTFATTGNDAESDNVYTPVITYKAVLNNNAVVGTDGNTNEAKLYYSNQPNNGQTHDTMTEPDPEDPNTPGIKVQDDDETKTTVYTYQLAFKKTGEGNDASKLPGAKFGIYKDDEGDLGDLVDVVTTNEHGYAVSSKVGAGTYYIKEIEAPAGYSLSEKVYQAEASFVNAKTEVTTATKTYISSTEPGWNEDMPHVGWFKDGVFYSMNQFEAEGDGVTKAYLSASSTTISSLTTGSEAGKGTVTEIKEKGGTELVSSIPNTKLSSLPSTGGIGTTIFTIGGCAIMILAAALYFATRRKAVK